MDNGECDELVDVGEVHPLLPPFHHRTKVVVRYATMYLSASMRDPGMINAQPYFCVGPIDGRIILHDIDCKIYGALPNRGRLSSGTAHRIIGCRVANLCALRCPDFSCKCVLGKLSCVVSVFTFPLRCESVRKGVLVTQWCGACRSDSGSRSDLN